MSCGQIALNKLGIKVKKYYASEIDKYAIKVTQHNFPNTIQIGDVTKVKGSSLPKIDILFGGSPCQSFSRAGDGSGFDGKSKLFWEYARLLKETKPKYFLLENVVMKKEWEQVITDALGVEPILINSALVSAQNRRRLYWTNIPNVKQPIDKNVYLKDIIESGEVDRDKSYCLDANYFKGVSIKQYLNKSRRQIVWKIPEATKKGYVEVAEGEGIDLTFIRSKTRRGRLMLEKSNCLTAASQKYCIVTKDWFRLLTPIECKRLQTVPDWFDMSIVSDTQQYRMLGNGWTVDVIVHILSHMKL
jgi:DNA-cytosine methyltransferase